MQSGRPDFLAGYSLEDLFGLVARQNLVRMSIEICWQCTVQEQQASPGGC